MKRSISFLFFGSLLLSLHAYADLVESSPVKKGTMLRAPQINAGKTECAKNVPAATRKLLFNYYHSIANTNYTAAQTGIDKYTKMIGKIYKESSGNAVGYSDMNGSGSMDAVRAFYKNGQKASIEMFDQLRKNKNVVRNHQTNIGLLQISPDQLFWRPQVRTLFNETIQRFNKNPTEGLKMCGTKELFSNSEAELKNEFKKFQQCSVGRKTQIVGTKTVPVLSDQEFECFDRWVSFCPSLNIAIGLKLPLKYFETRGAAPLCKDEINLVLASVRLDSENLLNTNKQYQFNINAPICI